MLYHFENDCLCHSMIYGTKTPLHVRDMFEISILDKPLLDKFGNDLLIQK